MSELSGGGREFGRIGLSEEQADLLEVATNFCREKSPIEKVRKLMETEEGFDQDVWREIAELGWLAIAIPEEYGGVGLSLAEVTPVMEQMGRAMMATPFLSTTLAAQAIISAGTQGQKETLLPKIAAGAVATLAVMEEEGNWDLSRVTTQATLEGDKITLAGEKRLVCDAMAADWIIISAAYQGAPAMFIVERSSLPDAALRRDIVIDETKRSYTLSLNDVAVDANALMETDRVTTTLAHLRLAASLLSAAECCGSAKSVIDYTIEYLNTRKQFGKLIGSYQSLKHPTVDAYVHYEQARSHLYSAAHCFNEQGVGEVATYMAKAQADAVLTYASDRSIQFHGGFGFTYDCDAQLYRRRAAWHAALYGDAEYYKKQLAQLLF